MREKKSIIIINLAPQIPNSPIMKIKKHTCDYYIPSAIAQLTGCKYLIIVTKMSVKVCN